MEQSPAMFAYPDYLANQAPIIEAFKTNSVKLLEKLP